MASRKRSAKAKPVLLEPIMAVEVVVPDEYMGTVNGDLISRRGRLEGMEIARYHADHQGDGAAVGDVRLCDRICARARRAAAAFTMHFGQYEEVPASIAEEIISKVQGKVTN